MTTNLNNIYYVGNEDWKVVDEVSIQRIYLHILGDISLINSVALVHSAAGVKLIKQQVEHLWRLTILMAILKTIKKITSEFFVQTVMRSRRTLEI